MRATLDPHNGAMQAIWVAWGIALSPTQALQEFQAEPALQGASLSVVVRRLDGSEVIALDPDRRLIPASNQKLLTAAYALSRLGPSFQTKTEVRVQGTQAEMKTEFDPSWSLDRLAALRAELPRIKSWTLVEPVAPYIPFGWELDDLPHRYAAPVSALMIEQNSFTLWGRSGKVWLPPEFGYRLRRMPSSAPVQVDVDYLGRVLTVSGRVPQAQTALETLAIPDPHGTLRRALGGQWKVNSRPSTWPVWRRFAGPNLGSLLQECLSRSQNLISEGLLLRSALAEGELPRKDPARAAGERLEKFLVSQVGVRPQDARVVDGSGLSRHNLVTARGIADLLSWIPRQSWGSEFRKALARPGEGTLRNRLIGVQFEGKTGTSNYTNSLSGYLTLSSGETWIVSILTNHALAPASEVRAALDRLVVRLAQNPIGTTLASSAKYGSRPQIIPDPSPRTSDWNRVSRSLRYGDFARPRPDRRTQSADAAAH